MITGSYDPQTSSITWTMAAIDPTTGDTDNAAEAGFLPPDDAAADGEGYVTFTGQVRPGTATATVTDVQATIVFIRNPALATAVWKAT